MRGKRGRDLHCGKRVQQHPATPPLVRTHPPTSDILHRAASGPSFFFFVLTRVELVFVLDASISVSSLPFSAPPPSSGGGGGVVGLVLGSKWRERIPEETSAQMKR